jgi:hypothetical protein
MYLSPSLYYEGDNALLSCNLMHFYKLIDFPGFLLPAAFFSYFLDPGSHGMMMRWFSNSSAGWLP